MKVSKVFLLMFFAFGIFSSFQAKSQAEVIFDNVITFKDANGDIFESINSKTTLSASGNIVKTATFQLPKGHYLIPEKGVKYIGARVKETNIFGELVVMYDYRVAIDKNGKFKITVHSNGAGTIFPAVFK